MLHTIQNFKSKTWFAFLGFYYHIPVLNFHEQNESRTFKDLFRLKEYQ